MRAKPARLSSCLKQSYSIATLCIVALCSARLLPAKPMVRSHPRRGDVRFDRRDMS